MGRLVSLDAWGECKGCRMYHDLRRHDGGLEVGQEAHEYAGLRRWLRATSVLSIKRVWRGSKAAAPRFQLKRDGPS